MPDCTSSAERPVLVAASAPEDKRLIMEALDELALPGVLVSDGAEAMQALCRRPNTFAALIVGERVDRVSGWTLCGLARDAGCPLPILLVTGDEGQLAAARAEGLRVTVLPRGGGAGHGAVAVRGLMPSRSKGVPPRHSAHPLVIPSAARDLARPSSNHG
jgi:CheY-like chemotaxis protein